MLKESEKTELKGSLADESGILITTCAFANSSGGTIFVGVDDSGKTMGISIGRNTIEQLARKITEQLTPPIYPNIEEMEVDGITILRLNVSKSEHAPHFYKGIAYKRVGKINKMIDPLELASLFRAKLFEEQHFDDKGCKEASVEDIDPGTLKRFAAMAGVKFTGTENALRSLKLIRSNRIVNAAVMFFGKNPSLLFPLYGIKCATFSERGEIKAMKDFSNNIFAIVDEAVSFASENIPKKLVFKAAMRTEVPIIPEMATREAIVNALIHRDYTFPSSVFLAVYPDRVVIKNPGMLPPDLSEKKLYVEHHSHPRNPLLAELAHKARYIEHWGTGTLRIISSMREAGLKDPEFRQDSGFFYVTLSFLKPELTKRQKRILALFREFDTATLSKIKQLLRERVTDRAIRKDLQMLVENGLIIKKNAGKHTTYSIILHA